MVNAVLLLAGKVGCWAPQRYLLYQSLGPLDALLLYTVLVHFTRTILPTNTDFF